MDLTIGTAGHIDHGKTALIKALTGIETDRLPEEKRRGITIDIGFAELDIDGVRLSFVDVPGHEKFVKNMLAGAGGIDAVLLVVAADEGVMPQTREHFNICRLLGITSGIIVLTRCDLADADTAALAEEEVRELTAGSFLEHASVMRVSSLTGEGIDELRSALKQLARGTNRLERDGIAYLPVDRNFTVKGHGTVVTGTLRGGPIAADAALELLPRGAAVRVRGLQSHGKPVSVATPGRRVAVNLAGVSHDEITRGDWLAESAKLRPTAAVDALIEVLADSPVALRTRQRVRVSIGTAEVLGRLTVLSESDELAQGESGVVQIRFETPTLAVFGTRFIIRSYSPQATIAGGRVLDPFPSRHRRAQRSALRERFSKLADPDISDAGIVLDMIATSTGGHDAADIAARTAWSADRIAESVAPHLASGDVVDLSGRFVARAVFETVSRSLLSGVAEFHKAEPLAAGVPKELLLAQIRRVTKPTAAAILDRLMAEGRVSIAGERVALAGREKSWSGPAAEVRKVVLAKLHETRLEVPRAAELISETSRTCGVSETEVRKVFHALSSAGEIIKVNDEFYFDPAALASLAETLRAVGDDAFDVPRFKTIAGVSRKYAIPLLEYFDREKITIRMGDKRIIRK